MIAIIDGIPHEVSDEYEAFSKRDEIKAGGGPGDFTRLAEEWEEAQGVTLRMVMDLRNEHANEHAASASVLAITNRRQS